MLFTVFHFFCNLRYIIFFFFYQVTRRMPVGGKDWDWASIGDSFQNGAFFKQTGSWVRPNYNKHQAFLAASANEVRSLTKDAGALSCSAGSAC